MSDDPLQERRVRIADAALRLLASDGARGLTHRAVDAELSLPNGSTSYYFRTRAALLLAAAERLLELDAADAAGITPDAAGLTSLLGRWLTPEGRNRSLARMELLLEAARNPELSFMVEAREQFIRATEQALSKLAAKSGSADDAISLVALMDGLTLHGLVTGTLSPSTAQNILEQHAAKKPRSR